MFVAIVLAILFGIFISFLNFSFIQRYLPIMGNLSLSQENIYCSEHAPAKCICRDLFSFGAYHWCLPCGYWLDCTCSDRTCINCTDKDDTKCLECLFIKRFPDQIQNYYSLL